jgi:anti-sigma factor RsiW
MALTDLEIHAYVDDELASRDRDRVEQELMNSEQCSDYLSALRSLKQLIRCAYSSEATDKAVQ